MAAVSSAYPGVRYRDHATRKHGIKPDRYFFIRYRLEGKVKEEAVGWTSEGMTAQRASEMLATLKQNIRAGIRPQSLAEMREMEATRQEEASKAARAKARKGVPVDTFMESDYWPMSDATKKARSVAEEKGIYRRELKHRIGELSFVEITPLIVEAIARETQSSGKAMSTVTHILALIRQIWNLAVTRGIVTGETPTKRVRLPKKDNRRMRFLSSEEAQRLLEGLKERSVDVHDTALLSLFAGLRVSEIHALTWGDVNLDAGTLYIRDPKNAMSRHAYITPEIRTMLIRRGGGGRQELVFPARGEKERRWLSSAFPRTVAELGLNDGVEDARQKVVFHTLRHTFASWLVQKGTPLYTVAELMGHTSLEMTKRYSHLAPDTMRAAAMSLTGILDKKPATVIPFEQRA